MKYCYECGSKLEEKYLDKEGMIPYCPTCQTYRFPIYNTAVSMEVLNPAQTHVLLIQQYGRKRNILVAGYVNRGEAAEDAVAREVREEIGLQVHNITFRKSKFFEPSNTLMLNFSCVAESEDLSGMTDEVDHAEWIALEESEKRIVQNSLAQEFLINYLNQRTKECG